MAFGFLKLGNLIFNHKGQKFLHKWTQKLLRISALTHQLVCERFMLTKETDNSFF